MGSTAEAPARCLGGARLVALSQRTDTRRIHTLSPSSGLYSQPPEVRRQASPSLSARSHPENRPQQRTASQLRSPRDWLLPGQ